MLSFLEVVHRASTGPICSERDFDLRVFVPNLRRVLKKYGIEYDAEHPVPADDDLADRVWAAGLDFLCETGVYCLDTERRMLFSRKEIEAALEAGPRGVVFGAGTDAKALPRRVPEDETPPWCSGGGGGSPVSSERILLNIVKGYAENPLGDSINTPSLSNVDGYPITAGSPLEIEGAIRTMVLAREALRRAGRQDMPIVNGIASAIHAAGQIAGHRYGIRKTDAVEISTIHEMKLDLDSLNKVAYSLSAGNLIWLANGTMLGGLAGGPAGVAVVTAAYNPVDLLVFRAAVQHSFAVHFDLRTTSTRGTIWAQGLANQAVTRNSPLPVASIAYAAAGPTTEMAFYEFAACVITSVVSGGSIETGPSATGAVVDHASPMEPIFCSEVAHAVAGMSRKEANGIVMALLEKYEDRLRDPPLGKRYQDCFDAVTGVPSKKYIELYKKVRQEMTEKFGLRFRHTSHYS